MTLTELLSQKDVVILDGAMGTELAREGVDIGLPLWSANALLKVPQVVRSIHGEYLRAGADVITTNTFRSNLRALKRSGLEHRWEELNRIAVELAFEARERYPILRPVLIAGSMAPVEDCYSPALVPEPLALLEEHTAQANLLAQLGVDFLLGETLTTTREAIAVAKAAASTGKEFALSFFCKNDKHLFSGERLAYAVSQVLPLNPAALLVNCIPYTDIHGPLQTLHAETTTPFGCYANTGNPVSDDAIAESEPMAFGPFASQWADMGARLIGGCCGTTPEHIYAILKALRLRG